jgi:hypothetical protein
MGDSAGTARFEGTNWKRQQLRILLWRWSLEAESLPYNKLSSRIWKRSARSARLNETEFNQKVKQYV